MDFTKILCLALVIGFATSQPAIPLNRVINIYVNDGNGVDPATFNLPPNNRDIRCTQIQETFARPGQGTNEADVINAMRLPLAGFLTQAEVRNRQHWVQPGLNRGGVVTPDDELIHDQQMTLQDFMNMLNLNVPQAGHFLGIRNVRARRQDYIRVTVSYHATRRGEANQHHTISFNIQGI